MENEKICVFCKKIMLESLVPVYKGNNGVCFDCFRKHNIYEIIVRLNNM